MEALPMRTLAPLAVLLLGACGASGENAVSNDGVISAAESEREYMSNGFTGERSSNPKDKTESGTTGQSNVAGSAPGPGANGGASENTTLAPRPSSGN